MFCFFYVNNRFERSWFNEHNHWYKLQCLAWSFFHLLKLIFYRLHIFRIICLPSFKGEGPRKQYLLRQHFPPVCKYFYIWELHRYSYMKLVSFKVHNEIRTYFVIKRLIYKPRSQSKFKSESKTLLLRSCQALLYPLSNGLWINKLSKSC